MGIISKISTQNFSRPFGIDG